MAVKPIDQFVGSLVGIMTGDALGRSNKEHSPQELLERANAGQEMIGGFYTEDTELTFNVIQSLLDNGEIDPDKLAQQLGEHLNPMRGHNPGELEVLYRLQQGMDWRDANRIVFQEGSFGLGGSCRAAPVGLYYHDDLETLIEQAALSARITHAHPLGEAGAVTVALAVAFALDQLSPRDLFDAIQDRLASTGYAGFLLYLAPIPDLLEAWPNPVEVAKAFDDNRLTATACVPAALYSVLRHPDSFEKAVSFAVSLGGDADTTGAIAGAIAGAYYGVRDIPSSWLNRLENEDHGRDTMIDLGKQLFDAWKKRRA
jgi:poly(ADP-ribose) glycohydrolase ARH3